MTKGLERIAAIQKPGFFSSLPTNTQIKIDMIFGIILPLICIIADPIVFKDWGGFTTRHGILSRYREFAYTFMAINIVTLLFYLVSKKNSLLMSGCFFAGGIFAFVLGLRILPLSLVGLLFYGMGLLGFTPFLSAFVYICNGIQAYQMNSKAGHFQKLQIVLLGFAFTVSVPIFVHLVLNPDILTRIESLLWRILGLSM